MRDWPRKGTFVQIQATLRRLSCPTHGVVVEAVPFARPGAHLTRDFDDLLAWLATRMDKTAIAQLCRVSWRTVGRSCARVVATELDPGRLDGLFRIGVDEISWRKHHKYLTLVVDHDRGKVIWGAEGRDAATLDGFFDELGEDRAAQIQAVSLDLGPAYLRPVVDPSEGYTTGLMPARTSWLWLVFKDMVKQLRARGIDPVSRQPKRSGPSHPAAPRTLSPCLRGSSAAGHKRRAR